MVGGPGLHHAGPKGFLPDMAANSWGPVPLKRSATLATTRMLNWQRNAAKSTKKEQKSHSGPSLADAQRYHHDYQLDWTVRVPHRPNRVKWGEEASRSDFSIFHCIWENFLKVANLVPFSEKSHRRKSGSLVPTAPIPLSKNLWKPCPIALISPGAARLVVSICSHCLSWVACRSTVADCCVLY